MAKIKVLATIGTRPEAIKMAPIVHALRLDKNTFDCRVVATAQHRELLDQILTFFGITADVDFNIMRPGQQLAELTARMLPRLDELLVAETPDWVLAQGDTTTVFVTALACFYRRIKFGHVEAGLRTGDKYFPFPEEINRVLAGHLADLHFAPTKKACENLLHEGISGEQIIITGNTVVDALRWATNRLMLPSLPMQQDGRLLLVTAHRRENFGRPLEEICEALAELNDKFPDTWILYPVHPNPNIGPVVKRILKGRPRVVLCAPLGYLEFLAGMKAATLILSDSGGVQEEAPSLGKPVLVLRDETERPEAVAAGCACLVGPHRENIVREASRLLEDPAAYARMANVRNPFGDGRASERICAALANRALEPFDVPT